MGLPVKPAKRGRKLPLLTTTIVDDDDGGTFEEVDCDHHGHSPRTSFGPVNLSLDSDSGPRGGIFIAASSRTILQ